VPDLTTPRPLVSVIVPAHNAEAFLDRTLASALRQTYEALEIVVVDDGSSDRTRSIAEGRAMRDPRIRVIAQPNRGVVSARNRALEDARGELIAPLDADDVWDPTKIERQVARLLEVSDETGLVYCWWLSIDTEDRIVDRSPEWTIEGHAADLLLEVNWTGNASVPLYRRSCIDAVGGYAIENDACEDWDLALRVSERFAVAVVPAPLVGYRRHGGGLSAGTAMMWQAAAGVRERARRRRGHVSRATLRRSRRQFALYLAGVSYWSGSYGAAVRWVSRGWRSRVALAALPYVVRLCARGLLPRRRAADVIRPGAPFNHLRIPAPAIPYDRLYRRQSRSLI